MTILRTLRIRPMLLAFASLTGLVLPGPALAADDCPDAWITGKVKTMMLGNTVVGTFKMNIDTDECVVTLRGCVDTPAQKAEAAKVAKNVSGVKAVKNGLSICQGNWIEDDPDEPKKEKKAKEPGGDGKVDDCADAMITAEVKSMLMATTWIDAYRINVETEKCVVTLEGCVKEPAHKAKAEEMARKAAGVRSVSNQIGACPAKD